jgi:hypothetical protein
MVAGVVLFGAVASAAAGRHWIARTVGWFVKPADPQAARALPASSRAPLGRRNAGPIATADEISIAEPSLPATMPAPEAAAAAGRISTGGASPGGVGGPGRKTAGGRTGARHRGPIAARSTGTGAGAGRDAEVAAPPGGETTGDAPSAGDRAERTRRSDDSGLVFEAMHALRRDRAPVHAMKLLDEYARRHPGGPLAEEALALSIEAAAMSGDPRAPALIGQYLSRYPTGHFRAAVETSRARLAP